MSGKSKRWKYLEAPYVRFGTLPNPDVRERCRRITVLRESSAPVDAVRELRKMRGYDECR